MSDFDTELLALYPDVARAGSLLALLREHLTDAPASLSGVEAGPYGAGLRAGDRDIDVSLAMHERAFQLTFWQRGVQLVQLASSNLQLAVRALHSWLQGSGTVAELSLVAAGAEALKVAPAAEAYEAGPEAYVEFTWAELRAQATGRFRELVEAAHAAPELRRLLPYTTAGTLHFSRRTGFPFSWGEPALRVHGAHFQCLDVTGKQHAEGNAFEVVWAAVAILPPHSGPARHGTASDDRD